MSIERLRQLLSNIETAVAVLCNHPEPTVSSTGQTIGLHMKDAEAALDNIANELNKVEIDTLDEPLVDDFTKPSGITNPNLTPKSRK